MPGSRSQSDDESRARFFGSACARGLPMNGIPHIPALRRGKVYESLDKIEVKDHRTGEIKASVSQVNAGVVRKDLQRVAESRAVLKKFTVAQLTEICSRAGEE